MHRKFMDGFIDTIEWIAAAFVGVVVTITFINVLMRYLFSSSIPDGHDIGAMLLGILIFWGIAATSYRGTHITVDFVWGMANPKWKRYIDIFATLVLLFVVAVQTYTLLDKVVDTWRSNALTYDLRIPTWPFTAVAWIGDVSAVLLIAIRTWRLIFHPEEIEDRSEIKPVD